MSQDNQDPQPEQETSRNVVIPSEVLEQLKSYNVIDAALKPRHKDVEEAFLFMINNIYVLGRQSLSEVIRLYPENPIIAGVNKEFGSQEVLQSIIIKDQSSYPTINGLLKQSKRKLLKFNGVKLDALEISTSPLDYDVLGKIVQPKDNILHLPFVSMLKTIAIDTSEFSEMYSAIEQRNENASKAAIQFEIFALMHPFRGGSASGEG